MLLTSIPLPLRGLLLGLLSWPQRQGWTHSGLPLPEGGRDFWGLAPFLTLALEHPRLHKGHRQKCDH